MKCLSPASRYASLCALGLGVVLASPVMLHAHDDDPGVCEVASGALEATPTIGLFAAPQQEGQGRSYVSDTCVWVRHVGAAGLVDECTGNCTFEDRHGRARLQPCTWQTKHRPADRFGPAENRRWCGCPGEGEPSKCHVVFVEEFPPGEPPRRFRDCQDFGECADPNPCCEPSQEPHAAHVDVTCRCQPRPGRGQPCPEQSP